MVDGKVDRLLADLHRRDYGRILSAVARRFNGDLELAEDVVQEAFVAALDQWSTELPTNPAGWLYRAAHNKAVDRVRRRASFEEKAPLLVERGVPDGSDSFDEVDEPISDERLRLIFTCCHPVLGQADQMALTLKAVGGLSTAEIANGLVLAEPTVAQRMVRAKKKLKAAAVAFDVPEGADLVERLPGVLGVIHLIFTEGHSASGGAGPVRVDLCHEAIGLAAQLVDLMPDEAETMGLLALLYMSDARRPARVDDEGRSVPLSEQDRRRWNRRELESGAVLLERALPRGPLGPYQLQAAIAAVHGESPSWDETDWLQIAALYGELEQLTGSPVVTLNRAMAESYLRGPAAALVTVEALAGPLKSYQPWHAARADLLDRLDRRSEASAAFNKAIELAGNEGDRALLARRRDASEARNLPTGVDFSDPRSTD